jgi:hypothetical protein
MTTAVVTAFAFTISLPIKAQSTMQQKWRHPTQAMIPAEEDKILNDMRQKRNDTEKIAVLKAGVKDKGIMVDQLIPLLNQFLTDEAKLQCAEFAYPYTVDYKTFGKIDDLFSDQDHKNQLDEFVRKSK